MAIESTPKRVSVSLKLNNGTDADGNVKTVGLTIGTLSITNYDAEKAYQVAKKLESCLSKPTYAVEETKVSTLSAAV